MLPASELAAIHYARHWAENNTKSTDVEKKRLIEIYGQETADAIYILLRMIRIGNLSGNTWDSWLYRLTFWQVGFASNLITRCSA
jgi:hypothetical protein